MREGGGEQSKRHSRRKNSYNSETNYEDHHERDVELGVMMSSLPASDGNFGDNRRSSSRSMRSMRSISSNFGTSNKASRTQSTASTYGISEALAVPPITPTHSEADGLPSSNASRMTITHSTSTSTHNKRQKILFDSILPQFHFNIFCFQFIAHFFPSILIFASPNPYAQGIRWDHWNAIRFNVISPLMFLVMILSYSTLSPHDVTILYGKHHAWIFLIPAMFFLVHRMAIAWKYATMSLTEYDRLMYSTFTGGRTQKDTDREIDSAEERERQQQALIDGYVQQLELLSGWIMLDDHVLDFELAAASARIGNALNEVYLILGPIGRQTVTDESAEKKQKEKQKTMKTEKEIQIWSQFLHSNNANTQAQSEENGLSSSNNTVLFAKEIEIRTLSSISSKSVDNNHTDVNSVPPTHYAMISASHVCKHILRSINTFNNQQILFFIALLVYGTVCLMILLFILPVFMHAMQLHRQAEPERVGKQIEEGVSLTFFLLSSIILMWDYGRAYFFFLAVSLIDTSRYLQVVQTLHQMIRLNDFVLPSPPPMVIEKDSEDESDRQSQTHRKGALPWYLRQEADNRKRDLLNLIDMDVKTIKHIDKSERETDEASTSTHSPMQTSSTQPHIQTSRVATPQVVPKLDLMYIGNIEAWMTMRLTMQHFGERFRFRTDGYLALTGILTFLSMIFALIGIAQSDDPPAAYRSVLFIQAILSISLFIVLFTGVLAVGMLVNNELAAHCRTLGAHIIQIKTKFQSFYDSYYHFNSSKDREREHQFTEQINSLERVLRIAEMYNVLKPYKVFGLTARGALVVSILTMSLSFYGIVFSFYSTTSSSSTPSTPAWFP